MPNTHVRPMGAAGHAAGDSMTTETTHHCPICGDGTTSRRSLGQHMRRRHPGSRAKAQAYPRAPRLENSRARLITWVVEHGGSTANIQKGVDLVDHFAASLLAATLTPENPHA